MDTPLNYIQTGDLFEIALSSPITLSEGHYWISIMADMQFGVGGQWAWNWADAPQKFNQFHNQDPCNLLVGSWSTTWDLGSNTPGWGGRTNYDLCFALHEGEAPDVPLSNNAIWIFVILIGGLTTFRIFK